MITNNEFNTLLAWKNCFYFAECFKVGNILVQSIQNLNEVFIRTFLILLVFPLEDNYDKIVVFKLFHHLFLPLHSMNFNFLAWTILIQIFHIPFEWDNDIAISHKLHNLNFSLHYTFLFIQIFKPKYALFVWIIEIYLVDSSCKSGKFYFFFI